jgi:4'-phosphopantetheinyl transferase
MSASLVRRIAAQVMSCGTRLRSASLTSEAVTETATALVQWLALADVAEPCWAFWPALLNDAERARADRFVHKSDAQPFVAAHALLRVMLSRAAPGTAPQDWRFVANAYGKPSLHPDHGLPALAFNLSHTRGAVTCGIAPDRPIGVDIEDATRTGDHLAIARSFFAASEVALLRAASEAERPGLFLRLWTLKEAYIKACGQGLSMKLDGFAFSLDPPAIRFADPAADDPAQWHFTSIACTRRHRLAVAIRSAAAIALRTRRITADDIASPPATAALDGDQFGEDR